MNNVTIEIGTLKTTQFWDIVTVLIIRNKSKSVTLMRVCYALKTLRFYMDNIKLNRVMS